MEHIKRQLNFNLNKKGLSKIAQASYVCYLFEQNREKLLGKDIPAKAVSFKDGLLKIKATDSSAASEIRFREREIKESLNKEVGGTVILKIRTIV